MTDTTFRLEDRFLLERGTVALSGIQALVRVPIDLQRADARRGLRTAGLISGYRGSPLGGLDVTAERNIGLLGDHDIRFISGLNEDLAATAVAGSQQAAFYPEPLYDGVFGMWYGKAPGLDRSGDAIRHANLGGVDPNGGVLAVTGDDPACKSSTLPSGSETALYDLQLPVLYPGTVQEILDYGRWGFELSRYSGLWVGLKVATNVADAYETAEVDPDRIAVIDPGFEYRDGPWQPIHTAAVLAPTSLELERDVNDGRLEAAKAFISANRLGRQVVPVADAWLGIVAAGKTFYDVREALHRLGLDDAGLARRGIRLYKLGAVYPLARDGLTDFAAGLDEILVVEEKRGFVETMLREALYDLPDRPRITGKRDHAGALLVPSYGELDADVVLPVLVDRITQRVDAGELAQPQRPAPALSLLTGDGPEVVRTPHFCSGCPHNRSTVVPDGSIAGGGIGCHGMALLMDRETQGITQMGGEGVQWVGAAPFSGTRHVFQNLGDGTYFHSGSLAIRQAVAAGTDITYKLLYNAAVAMTGGQDAAGAVEVPALTQELAAEGVARTIVVAEDPDKYPDGAAFAEGVDVWDRGRLMEAQETLRDTAGVTVLIYDQACAADLRRQRKRGTVADPATRIVINTDVCEGCADCSVKSNCLSVQPVETEFGRKMTIHQPSCNKDYTCIDGDCPSFVQVVAKGGGAERALVVVDPIGEDLPEPRRERPDEGAVYLMGIGGTGVVTVNQLLATAALLDGKHAVSLDQTGLSQKAGPVVSSLKVSRTPIDESNKVGVGRADAYLVFDMVTGTAPVNLDRARPGHTVAVVSSSVVPTAAMVGSTDASFPELDRFKRRIDARTAAGENVWFDAEAISKNLFRSHMPANVIVVGAAYQAGVVPLSAEAIEKAIELNGVDVDDNRQAFRVGRKLVADPRFAETVLAEPTVTPTTTTAALSRRARTIVDGIGASGELARLVEIRVPDLIDYQNAAYAQAYADFVTRVRWVEEASGAGRTELSEAVARYLYKLMAYKDEYEVARLHLKSGFTERLSAQFGDDAEVTYLLQPPAMTRIGLDRKIKLRSAVARPNFKALARMKRLRGTALDAFGRTDERRMERALIDEYRGLVEARFDGLSAASYDTAVAVAESPDVIRGYAEVKMRNVTRWREHLVELGV